METQGGKGRQGEANLTKEGSDICSDIRVYAYMNRNAGVGGQEYSCWSTPTGTGMPESQFTYDPGVFNRAIAT